MRRKLFLFFFFGTLSILCLFLLRFPAQAGALAANGLTLWFSKMIPALFPFMILSGLFLSTGFSNLLARLAAPVLQPVFQTSAKENFPPGSFLAARLYKQYRTGLFFRLCPDAVSGAYSADGLAWYVSAAVSVRNGAAVHALPRSADAKCQSRLCPGFCPLPGKHSS